MGTAMSYIVLAACAVAATYYYNPDQFKRVLDKFIGQPGQVTISEIPQPSKKAKQKRSKQTFGEQNTNSTPVSSNEAPVSKKRKIISDPVGNQVTARTSEGNKATLQRNEHDDDIDNAEFARQLKQAQQGTKLQPKVQQIDSKTERRAAEARPNGLAANAEFDSAETSSNGGRDADDDMSPVDTPPSSVSRAGDVSDMLEPAASQLASIRLTHTESSQPKKAVPKQFEAAQTKKQRQRQKQNEENKKLREEADKQHAAKMHKQIHGARMAEGTSKQSKATSFGQTAWQAKPTQAEAQPEQPAQQSLLDTFDPSEANTKPSVTSRPIEEITNGPQANVDQLKESIGEGKTQALAASTRERPEFPHNESWADQLNADAQDQWERNLVEEEQWEAVTTKKGRKKGKKDNDTSSEASQPIVAPALASATNTATAVNGKQPASKASKVVRPQTMNRFESVAGDEWEA